MGQKSVGAHSAEGPTVFGERGSHRLEDYRLSHLGHGSSPPLTGVCPLSVRDALSSSSCPTAASGRPRAAFHTRTCCGSDSHLVRGPVVAGPDSAGTSPCPFTSRRASSGSQRRCRLAARR